MKRKYSSPTMGVTASQPSVLLQGSKFHTDDPKTPGSALSREREDWGDDELWDGDYWE